MISKHIFRCRCVAKWPPRSSLLGYLESVVATSIAERLKKVQQRVLWHQSTTSQEISTQLYHLHVRVISFQLRRTSFQGSSHSKYILYPQDRTRKTFLKEGYYGGETGAGGPSYVLSALNDLRRRMLISQNLIRARLRRWNVFGWMGRMSSQEHGSRKYGGHHRCLRQVESSSKKLQKEPRQQTSEQLICLVGSALLRNLGWVGVCATNDGLLSTPAFPPLSKPKVCLRHDRVCQGLILIVMVKYETLFSPAKKISRSVSNSFSFLILAKRNISRSSSETCMNISLCRFWGT